MKATKGNKTYTISEQEKKRYQDAGYDILDDLGKVITYGRGKTVTYEQYGALKTENEELKVEIEKLKASEVQKDDPTVLEILNVYATEHEIDIGKATTASGIAKKIKESAAKVGE